jgi:GTP-binding protein
VIVHLVDVSDEPDRPDPVEDFKIITAELKSFDPSLAERPTILVAAKADVANADKLKKLSTYAKRRKLQFFAISAVTGEGVEPLKYAIAALVEKARPTEAELAERKAAVPEKIKRAYPPPKPKARGRAR